MPGPRMRRINEVLREVVGAAISGDLSDPRIGFVTVLGDEAEREETLSGLRSSHGVLQSQIATETRMKRTPTLTFLYHDTIAQGVRISQLLDEEPAGEAEETP